MPSQGTEYTQHMEMIHQDKMKNTVLQTTCKVAGDASWEFLHSANFCFVTKKSARIKTIHQLMHIENDEIMKVILVRCLMNNEIEFT